MTNEAAASSGRAPTGSIDHTFRIEDAARLIVRGINRSNLAITEIRVDWSGFGDSNQVFQEDAFIVGLQLRANPIHTLWSDGREIPVRNVRPGDSLFYDMKTAQGAHMQLPFHSLVFYLPRVFLNELAHDVEAPRIDQLRPAAAIPVHDAIIARMGASLRPALETPQAVNELYASHMMLAFGAYVGTTYGGLRPRRRAVGGLDVAQERIATELMDAHLDGSLTIQAIAAACGLSTSRFAHSFRTSLGVAPHRWLVGRRIDHAKDLLRQGRATLSDIALVCGFADQSHFTRCFRAATGYTPGNWREVLH